MEMAIEDLVPELGKFINGYFKKQIDSITAIPGDAGLRSYYRLQTSDKSYIVMSCPPDYCSILPFVNIANYLRQNGFSTPEIFHIDDKCGFMILEDFGLLDIKSYLQQNTDNENYKKLYYLIVDLLVLLQSKPLPDNLPEYTNQLLLSELSLFTDYYIPYAKGRVLSGNEIQEFNEIWQEILSSQVAMPSAVVMRDYHVENMMYLSSRSGVNKLGLLDFQDALIGSPIYDLVSVFEDARIEVGREFALDCIRYFADQKKLNFDAVMQNYHILGAQRNCRILGVFVRKAVRDNNNNYLQYLPLVLKYLEYDLSHSKLSAFNDWLEKI